MDESLKKKIRPYYLFPFYHNVNQEETHKGIVKMIRFGYNASLYKVNGRTTTVCTKDLWLKKPIDAKNV